MKSTDIIDISDISSMIETTGIVEQIELVTYNQLEEKEVLQNIVGTLVENIYNDDSYQEYLKDLQETGTELSSRKVKNIQQTFTDMRVFNTNKSPLFLANDIGIIIGASNVNATIRNYSITEKITGMIVYKNKLVKRTFLTKNGMHRLLFNNKTKLAEVFRGLIYKLTDYMFEYEYEKVKTIIGEFTSKNSALINASKIELESNVKKYKSLYEFEQKERTYLEISAVENYKLLKEIESERNEVEIEQSFNVMYIEQLKNEKNNVLEKIYNIQDESILDETNQALLNMKKKFLKEFTISLVTPKHLSEFFNQKKNIYDLSKEYNYDSYINDFDFIVNILEVSGNINIEEIFYLHVELKVATKSKEEIDPNYVYAASEYVQDKTKFLELMDLVKLECESYQIGTKKGANSIIYKTTIEHIKSIARNLIISII